MAPEKPTSKPSSSKRQPLPGLDDIQSIFENLTRKVENYGGIESEW
jgi:hypothetical protein